MRYFYINCFFLFCITQFTAIQESIGQSPTKIDSMVGFSIGEFNMELYSQQYPYSSWIKNIFGSRADTNTYLLINKNYVSLYSLQDYFSLPYFPKHVLLLENGKASTYEYVDSISRLKKTKIERIKKRPIGVVEVSRIDFANWKMCSCIELIGMEKLQIHQKVALLSMDAVGETLKNN